MDDAADDSAPSNAFAPDDIGDPDDLEAAVADATVDAEDDVDSAAAGVPEAAGAGAARLMAARFSPHSTQKRAPVTTGAPHCGQNRTALRSGL
jgi:hypothetical protein